MNLAAYSIVVSALVLLLGTATFLSILGYCFSPTIRARLDTVSYTAWLALIGATATIATLGSLTYQFVYLTPVCVLCWWQRIFMFPIEIVILVSLYTRTKGNNLISGIMAGIGALFASYHYYGHYQKYVAGNPFLLPCSTNPLEVSCSNSPVVTFGFVTIPFLALITFIAIIWLSYLAHKKSQTI